MGNDPRKTDAKLIHRIGRSTKCITEIQCILEKIIQSILNSHANEAIVICYLAK